jgi:hypothetical protein
MTDPLSELRARIALKRTRIAKIEQTAPDEPYPAVECPLCHKIYSKLPFDGHCYDCEDKQRAARQQQYIQFYHYIMTNRIKYKKRKIKNVEEWQDRY